MNSSDDSSATLVGAVVADRFRLRSLLGSGGMGSVYLASDEQLPGRHVAIKVPHEEFLLVAGFRRRFLEEIRQLVNLEHPHIVTIFDGGEYHGMPFAVLQYLAGGSLIEQLDSGRRTLSMAEILSCLVQLPTTL